MGLSIKMDDSDGLARSSELQRLRELSEDLVQSEYNTTIPSDGAPPTEFWDAYSAEQITIGLRLCLLL
ncbi:hypothetical protein BDN70DRAFT_884319 [Pholiota conissans]|uniref:Uncharacterized protein n=1 Tax=Pholiota conissans TaxID=109636 RepID=A0A9P5YS96_9AGAR|nr:hypothetical protein BDN70DRAFT_884319 [Pholiota conissans]